MKNFVAQVFPKKRRQKNIKSVRQDLFYFLSLVFVICYMSIDIIP